MATDDSLSKLRAQVQHSGVYVDMRVQLEAQQEAISQAVEAYLAHLDACEDCKRLVPLSGELCPKGAELFVAMAQGTAS